MWNIKGNACAGNAGAEISTTGTSGTLNQADNATDDTTGEIQNIVAADAWTTPGVTAASVFTVKNTSSVLYDAVNPTLLTTDITDFTRDGTNHDVGAFEFTTGVPSVKYVTIKLVASPTDSTPRATLSGLRYAFWEYATVDAIAAVPLYKASNGTTDANGFFTLEIPLSGLTNGQVGYLVITDSDGTIDQDPVAKGFMGPVLVVVP